MIIRFSIATYIVMFCVHASAQTNAGTTNIAKTGNTTTQSGEVIDDVYLPTSNILQQDDVETSTSNTANNTASSTTDNQTYATKNTAYSMENQTYSMDNQAYATDSLHLPSLNRYGRMRLCSYPSGMHGIYDWDLHRGLNVSLGASVFAAFGKHAPKGAGFGQNISAMYATPLTDKLTLAVGGYFSNTSWAGDSFRDAGLNAVLGYRFDEHWEAYLYGQKSLTPDTRTPLFLFDMSDMGDRIGAAVRYNFSPSFSIQMSVSASERRGPYFADFLRDVMGR